MSFAVRTHKLSPGQRLNSTPVAGVSFKDETMEFGKTYFYRVRAVASSLCRRN